MAGHRSARTKFPSLRDIEHELGGVEGFYTLFGIHYCSMFANPVMSVLFDSRHADTNVSALEHGKRVATLVLDRNLGTRYYDTLGRPSHFLNQIEVAH